MSLLCLLSSRLSLLIPAASLWSAIFFFFHIKPLPPSHFLYIFGLFVVSHSPHRGLLFSLLTLGVILPDSSDTRQHTKSFCLFFSHMPPVPKLLFLFLCLVVFFMFASSSLSLLFISADKYLIMSALTWHHCSLLELRVFRSRSRGWRRKHAALSNVHLSPFYLVTNLVVQFPEQPIADIYVLIMSKWARLWRAVANTSIYPTRILGYLGRILADVALAQTFFAEAIK